MIYIYVVLGLIVGGLIGFGAFYLRYQDRKVIDQLYKNYRDMKKENRELKENQDEINEQNKVLRNRVQELQAENEELAKIVADLSRYSYNIKIGGEKAKELSKILGVYDSELEERIKKVLHDYDDEETEEEEEYNDEKKF